MVEKKETSIIEIIQEMVAAGESEEKIVSTLKDLGVEPEKAKRLLLLGQADTFSILKGEIAKIVEDNVLKQQIEIKQMIQEESDRAGTEMKKKVETSVLADLKKYEKDITGQSKTFQEQINETVSQMADLNTRVKEKLNELGEKTAKVEKDMSEMHLRGTGQRNRTISLVLVMAGVAFLVLSLYLFFVNFQTYVTIDSIIITSIMALIGITLLFVATVI